jgi:hypothetical protein
MQDSNESMLDMESCAESAEDQLSEVMDLEESGVDAEEADGLLNISDDDEDSLSQAGNETGDDAAFSEDADPRRFDVEDRSSLHTCLHSIRIRVSQFPKERIHVSPPSASSLATPFLPQPFLTQTDR